MSLQNQVYPGRNMIKVQLRDTRLVGNKVATKQIIAKITARFTAILKKKT